MEILPASPARWADLEDLFGPERGGCAGCWCVWPRVSAGEFKSLGKPGRKAMFQEIFAAGPPPGLLAYEGETAVGWCAVGPRESYARFQSAKASRPLDDEAEIGPIWAITCFYIRNTHRKSGLMAKLAEAAVAHARAEGAKAVEACTIDPDRPLVWGDGFVGLTPVFQSLGFQEIARRSPRRPLMRLKV
jgi:predicted GNAT family acetyltransferase